MKFRQVNPMGVPTTPRSTVLDGFSIWWGRIKNPSWGVLSPQFPHFSATLSTKTKEVPLSRGWLVILWVKSDHMTKKSVETIFCEENGCPPDLEVFFMFWRTFSIVLVSRPWKSAQYFSRYGQKPFKIPYEPCAFTHCLSDFTHGMLTSDGR